MQAYIGLGSNLGDGPAEIGHALRDLDGTPSVKLIRQSSLYTSEAWGYSDQPDFTNAVAEIETDLSPMRLLTALQKLEQQLGRIRHELRWGPRSIDLDLLIYQDLICKSRNLEIPHPRMHERAFVLMPLLELEPDITIPGLGSARQCLAKLEFQVVSQIK